MIADCVSRTGFHTFSAADTLWMVRCFCYFDVHFAGPDAFPAAYAFFVIHLDFKKGYSVEQRVDGTKRTDPFTERTVKQNTQDNEKHKDRKLECKKVSKCSTDS